jgi:hypothetical protein
MIFDTNSPFTVCQGKWWLISDNLCVSGDHLDVSKDPVFPEAVRIDAEGCSSFNKWTGVVDSRRIGWLMGSRRDEYAQSILINTIPFPMGAVRPSPGIDIVVYYFWNKRAFRPTQSLGLLASKDVSEKITPWVLKPSTPQPVRHDRSKILFGIWSKVRSGIRALPAVKRLVRI